MLVASENGNFANGHNGQLEWRRDANNGAKRNQNGGRSEIGVQQTEKFLDLYEWKKQLIIWKCKMC